MLTADKITAITSDIYEMTLRGDVGENRPGQFANISVPGKFLRRPISVADFGGDYITLVFRNTGAGTGTDIMSKAKVGDTFDVLTGLGNGYNLLASGKNPWLFGGGVGTPPIYALAKALTEMGIKPTVALGFNSKSDIFYLDRFRALGAELLVATVDGSFGQRGFVTSLIGGSVPSYYYACGPLPMLRAVKSTVGDVGEMSFEERMGCGFGVCVGCTWNTKSGARRVCRDGPVAKTGELLWLD